MRSVNSKLSGWKVFIIILFILFFDQCSKIYIKMNFPLSIYGSDPIIDWGFFKLLFIENKGMAWGTKFNDFIPFISEENGKLFLTLLRVVAIFFISNWLIKTIKSNSSSLKVLALSLILAGAIGNIIDSIFYGVIFTHSYGQIAEIFPEKGYAPFLFGHVVDMLQFPLVSWEWPNWIPYIGGNNFTFFKYVFNIADTSISTGVGILLFFNKKLFN
ncbi:MAG: lipoprotein signal peptidase [Flavobacteriaceae bacterium]